MCQETRGKSSNGKIALWISSEVCTLAPIFFLLHSISFTEKKKPLKKYVLQVITHVGKNSSNAFVGHDIENKSWLKEAQLYIEVHK